MTSSITNETNSQSPPIQLNRAQFERLEPMQVVGVVCDQYMNRCVWAKMTQFRVPYLGVPRQLRTYHDESGLLRKLFLVSLKPPNSSSNGCDHNDDELTNIFGPLNIEHSQDSCRLDETESSQGHQNATTKTSQLGDASVIVLEPDQLTSIQTPGRLLLHLSYANFTFDQAVKVVLPDDLNLSGFTLVGHMAHFNLRDELLPYKHVIGQLAIDKMVNVRTAVHKASAIDSDYRTFQLELMAGEPNYETSVKENGVTFKFDFSKVYWNSRLGTEHHRLVDRVSLLARDSKTIIYDVFAGVGPFAIPMARADASNVAVHANDLNPDSFQWLKANVEANKSKKRPFDNLKCYNMDGREFIRQVAMPHYLKTIAQSQTTESSSPTTQSTIAATNFLLIMNLPALALDFFDAFTQLPTAHVIPEIDDKSLPPLLVRCYCFLRRNLESQETCQQRLANALNFASFDDLRIQSSSQQPHPVIDRWNLRLVRNVAPFKDMYCCEFDFYPTRLTAAAVVVPDKDSANNSSPVPNKRQKMLADS